MRNGTRGVALYLPSRIRGGARRAEDVTAQIAISAISPVFATGPMPATKGNAAKAAQDTSVTAPTKTPSRPTSASSLSAIMPIAVSVMVKIA